MSSEPTFDLALDRLEAAYQNGDEYHISHIRAVKALLDAGRPVSKRELMSELNLSGRQTTRVIRDLEDRGVLERSVSPRDYNTHVFELADAPA